MILVVGATGHLGGMITRQLLAQRQPVRILVRPGSAYEALAAAGAEPVFGDMKDAASLNEAYTKVNTVITTANASRRGGVDTVDSVDKESNRHLINAAKAAGVGQFIFISALGVSANSPIPLFQAKAWAEEYLRASGLPSYTILAPNLFMDGWIDQVVVAPVRAGEPVTLVGEGLRKHAFVAAADVAAFSVAAIKHPAAKDQYIAIGGPEAVSWRDIIARYERVLGRQIRVNSVAPGELVPGLPNMMSHLLAGMEAFDSPVDMTHTARTFNVTLTSVEEFLA
jgi:NADH dehydrogenase